MSERTHGKTGSRLYRVWSQMKARCYRKTCPDFPRYGARGITVCDRWRNSFQNFAADMGEPPVGLTLERADNNGPYSPDNCSWGTRLEQARNTRQVKLLTFCGVTKCVSQWEADLGFRPGAIRSRLSRGWTLEAALTSPRMSLSEAGKKSTALRWGSHAA